jgi:hypothetical protein
MKSNDGGQLNMNNEKEKKWLNPSVDRRTFMKVSGVLASTAMASQVFTKAEAAASSAVVLGENDPDPGRS